MAFKRKIEIIVSNNKNSVIISNLSCKFSCERTIKKENNTGQLVIYNAKENTRNNLLTSDSYVIVKAGYADEGNIGIIFSGVVTESINKKSSNTWESELKVQEVGLNKEGLKYTNISISYKEKTPLVKILNDISGMLNIPIIGLENSTKLINNGFTYAGNVTNLILELEKELNTEDNGVYFDNNEMVVYKKNFQNSKFGVIRVTGESGLIGFPEIVQNEKEKDDKKRIKFKSILNPKFKINSVINLNSKNITGSFIIEKINHIADNFGGDFISEVECKS